MPANRPMLSVPTGNGSVAVRTKAHQGVGSRQVALRHVCQRKGSPPRRCFQPARLMGFLSSGGLVVAQPGKTGMAMQSVSVPGVYPHRRTSGTARVPADRQKQGSEPCRHYQTASSGRCVGANDGEHGKSWEGGMAYRNRLAPLTDRRGGRDEHGSAVADKQVSTYEAARPRYRTPDKRSRTQHKQRTGGRSSAGPVLFFGDR